MKHVYLLAAVLGAALPYAFFFQHFGEFGLDLPTFAEAVFATSAASGWATDLLISSFVFWIYMFREGGSAPRPWPFIAINLLIGLSCALPAYLYWRARTEPA